MSEVAAVERVEIEDEGKRLQNEAVEKIGSQFSYYGLVSLVLGIGYSICLYKNPAGVMVPVFVLLFYVLSYMSLRKMGMTVKRESYVLVGISVLIGISTCRTANGFFIFYNKIALLLLAVVFWIHQFYEDRDWNIGTYAAAMVLFCGHVISMVASPFRHGIAFLKLFKDKRYRTCVMVFLGVVISIPFVGILTILLAEADVVFQNFLYTILDDFFNPMTMFSVAWRTGVGFMGMYCLICGAVKRGVSEEQKDVRKEEPVIAITVMSIIGMLYLVFCGIQIVYLFLGRGTLPVDVSYSQYARQGFFQLVFVAFVNLVLVLACLKYFKKSGLLNVVLTVISVCTYVMIASAGYRMVLYVQEYHLTLLRILVLWFLVVLAFLMGGVMTIIYLNRFPLFRYCLMVVSVGYLALVWMKPDYVIADYNVRHMEVIAESEIYYLTELSADAVPVLRELKNRSEIKEISRMSELLEEFCYDRQKRNMTWRTYNFSYARARNN